jgi:hypothetical protein
MKQKRIVIKLPNPCHENWNDMTPNEQGRHCASCSKTIVDFSKYNDRQLIEFFNKATSKICGHFSATQVNRELVYIEPRNHFLYKLLFGTALTLGIAGSVNANYNPGNKPLIHKYTASTQQKAKQENEKLSGGNDSIKVVKGTAIDDSTQCGIPYVEVELINKADGTILEAEMADINGRFTIDIPANYTDKELSVKIWHEGYKPATISYLPGSFPENIEVSLVKEHLYYLGELNVRGDACVYIVDGIKITELPKPIEKVENFEYFWSTEGNVERMPIPRYFDIPHGKWNQKL